MHVDIQTQARSQGGFEGVRTNPLCSLAKLIFNETAAVQGSHHAAATRVVTYMSPVEAFATGIKNFDR